MTKINFRRRLSQAGDTIPEVLICLAILGLTIVSAYSFANRSQSMNRSAQERTEALKLADGQLEMLKAYTDTHTKLPTNDYFCLVPNAGAIEVVDIGSDLEANPDAIYPAECGAGVDSRYSYAIWSPSKADAADIGGNGSSFAVIVNWDGITGQAQEVKSFYSIYEGSDTSFIAPISTLTPLPQCNNSRDDDGDGLEDADDPACRNLGSLPGDPFSGAWNSSLNSEVNPDCYDSSDNDGDGRTDYAQDNYGCRNWIDDDEEDPVCYDGIDNDSDGDTDFTEDASCEGNRDGDDEMYPLQCNDNVDNDADGRTDFPGDASCSNANDNDELNPTPPPRQALYICYYFNTFQGNDKVRTNHVYTVNPAVECAGAEGGAAIAGYVPTSAAPGSVPVYGGFNGYEWDDFYTLSYDEYVGAHYGGWNGNSGVRFYAYPNCSVNGTEPLERWWSGAVGNHVYMTDGGNPNGFLPADGGGTYVYEGTAMCMFSSTYP